jgi:hypothetical protein
LAVFEINSPGGAWGIYGMKTKRLVIAEKQAFAMSPDGLGFLVAIGSDPSTIAFIDWEAKRHQIDMKQRELDKGRGEKVLNEWDGTTFVGQWSIYNVRIDTEKRTGTFQEIRRDKDKALPEGQYVSAEYLFPEGGAAVQVISANESGKDKSAWPPVSRLEILKPGEKKPEVIVAKTQKLVSLIPAPNKKLLAIRIAMHLFGEDEKELPNKILIVDSQGRVVKEIFEREK